ncbi:hypothetical protein I5F00_08465 [Proteus mirabilis]|uniref:hypothetical protein n=1 Tax=Proteus mirabilis TaxID=584 RepID=UPI0018C77CE9|nr:hypothetical protein [Proteus mirabilis]
MTYQQYAKKIADILFQDLDKYQEVILNAELKIDESNLNKEEKIEFWNTLNNEIQKNYVANRSRPHLIGESQDSDSLSKIISNAKAIIAKNKAKI